MKLAFPRAGSRAGFAMAIGGERVPRAVRSLLLEAGQREFDRPVSRSATRALSDALLASHFLLHDRNAVNPREDRRRLSAAGAAQGPNGTYVGLTGQAYALVLAETGERTLVADAESFAGQPSITLHPLGGDTEPRFTLRLLPLAPGSRLVLVAGGRPPAWLTSSSQPPALQPSQLARLHGGEQDDSHVVMLDDRLCVLADESGSALQTHVVEERLQANSDGPSGLRAVPLTAAMAVLVLLLLALGVWASQPTRESALGPLDELTTLLHAVEGASDPREAVDLSQQAHELVERIGEESVPAELRSQLARASDRANRVERLGEARLLAADTQTAPDIVQMELSGDAVFLLGADGSVSATPLDTDASAPETAPLSQVVAVGQTLGGREVGHPLAIAWVPAGRSLQRSVLAVVDTERTIIAYDPGRGMSRVSPPQSDRWVELGPLAGADGALYLVDRGRGLVLEYPLDARGTAGPPRSVLGSDASRHVTQAADLAVSGADLYLLLHDGLVVRYDLDGHEQPFPAWIPDRPFADASALAVGRRTSAIYVADGGNQRIVELSRDGGFVRQLQGGDEAKGQLGHLRDLQVDEAARLLVCVSGREVKIYDLPPISGG